MELEVPVNIQGVVSGDKKDGSKFYKVDLYVPGVGAFDKMVTPDQFVTLSGLPAGTSMSIRARVVVREEKVPYKNGGGGHFTVRRLGLELGDLALAENARKAS